MPFFRRAISLQFGGLKWRDEMNLPSNFISVIQKYGITEKDIIFAATADFDSDYRFADSIVALTKEKLILAAYAYIEKAEYHFGGYGGWQPNPALQGEPAIQIFELNQVCG